MPTAIQMPDLLEEASAGEASGVALGLPVSVGVTVAVGRGLRLGRTLGVGVWEGAPGGGGPGMVLTVIETELLPFLGSAVEDETVTVLPAPSPPPFVKTTVT
jgi:hypothetical protein